MVKFITNKVSKGGVGKTTICLNIADILSKKNYKVLMIDLDAQSNLSKNFTKQLSNQNKLTSSNLLGDNSFNIKENVYNINENLDLIISDIGLSEVSRYLEQQENYYIKLLNLKNQKLFNKYDFVLLDLSPGVCDTITEISLCVTDLLICPTHFDIDSLLGIILTIEDVSRLSQANLIKKNLNYLVVPNRYDKRYKSDNQKIFDILYENIDSQFITNPIRENSHIKKARMIGKTAIDYELDEKRKYEHKKAIEDFETLYKKIIEVIKNE
ncbi:MAG: ParA family protein [Nanoarchaeota archaeon]